MSYRAFKRLLGETSLERKCRFLFGAGTLLLIVASFWWYARLTEYLAYDQTATTARLLETPIIAKKHEGLFKEKSPKEAEDLRTALAEFQERSEPHLPEALRQ